MIETGKKKIGSYMVYGLVFFLFSAICACTHQPPDDQIQLIWKGKKAVGVSIPEEFFKLTSSDSLLQLTHFQLASQKEPVAILGNFREENGNIVFTPLIPFTNGLQYEVVFRKKLLGKFEIPLPDPGNSTFVTAIFPSQDTLPENLLKIYVHFSQPMREGQSAQYVNLIKNDTDTVQGAFLNLNPELWNEERTILTLWLDPGRIKRDLKPNLSLGAPMQDHAQYRIAVSREWQSQGGNKLLKSFTKNFITQSRDSLSPKPISWKIDRPEVGSIQPLKIHFGEPLDHGLLTETLVVQRLPKATTTWSSDTRITELNENYRIKFPGKWRTTNEEKTAVFVPSTPWQHGYYLIRIETRLEDLAGNNLNRRFETDVSGKTDKPKSGKFAGIPVEIF